MGVGVRILHRLGSGRTQFGRLQAVLIVWRCIGIRNGGAFTGPPMSVRYFYMNIRKMLVVSLFPAACLAGTITPAAFSQGPNRSQFNYTNIASFAGSSGLDGCGFDYRDAFGGTFNSCSYEGQGTLIFENRGGNFFLDFSLRAPVTIYGFRVYLTQDGAPGDRARTVTHLKALAGSTVLADEAIIPAGTTYSDFYPSYTILLTETFSAVTAQSFSFIFSANNDPTFPGVRVLDIESVDGPEPTTMLLAGAVFLFAIIRDGWPRRPARWCRSADIGATMTAAGLKGRPGGMTLLNSSQYIR